MYSTIYWKIENQSRNLNAPVLAMPTTQPTSIETEFQFQIRVLCKNMLSLFEMNQSWKKRRKKIEGNGKNNKWLFEPSTEKTLLQKSFFSKVFLFHLNFS